MGSRYPQPGTTVLGVMDEGYRVMAVVVATSRHRKRIAADEAQTILDAHYGRPIAAEACWWRSVTRSDLDEIDADEGGWHSEATGTAWVEILWPSDKNIGSEADDEDPS